MSILIHRQGVAQSSAAASGDPHFASVVLLLDFAGTNGGQDAVDHSNSAHTLTWAGNAQVSTAYSLYGSSSLLLDGTGDYVSIANHTDFDFGNGDFTFEARINLAASTLHMSIFGRYPASGREFDLRRRNTNTMQALLSSNGSSADLAVLNGSATFGTGVVEVCFERSGGTLRIYVDGAVDATDTGLGTTAIHDSANALFLGDNGAGETYFNGNLDEIRITKGVARYQGAYTPTAEEWPKS